MEGICNSGSQILSHAPARIPVDGTFELTVRCNLHCKMCLFRHDDSENSEIRAAELSADQWIDLARQAAEAGTFSLLLTGGEPMLRPDFCEIYEGIYKQGFILTLYTNATLVTPEIMEVLHRCPPNKIGVTIYGASPETYEKVCGDAKAYERMIHGVKELQTLPSILDFRTTVIKDNCEDLDGIDELLRDTFQVDNRLTQTRIVTSAVRGACADVPACRLEPEDNVHMAFRRGINLIKKYVGDEYSEENLHFEYVHDEEQKSQQRISLFGCDAGMRSYTISWDGKLLGCQMLGLFYTDVINQPFMKAWEEYPGKVKLPEIHADCKVCKMASICNCCPASRYAETGDLGGKPEYVCRDTAIIYKSLSRRNIENE